MSEPFVAYYEGKDRPPQRIDRAQLSTEHQWPTQPEVNPSFQQYVETNMMPRCDMAGYKTIFANHEQHGRDAWSALCKSRSLFRIPESIQCDRTFVRDNEEAYYIDAMDAWLKGLPDDITVQDIPFVKRSLHHRLIYAFSRRTGYFTELFERRRTGLLLAFDAHENKYYGDVELHERHPRVDKWLEEIDQPPALPVPLAFVAFYYHTELLEAQRRRDHGLALSERQRRLLFCLEHEYYILFLAMWWSEAFYGRRQFLVSTKTIDELDAHCGNLAVIGIKPVQVIIEYMRTASSRSSSMYVWLAFRNNWMEESTFVWGKKKSGEHDSRARPVRTTLWADKNCRRITMTAHSAKIYKRNTALEKTLGDPDLDKIPGLLDLVYEQKWNLHGDMRVGDLVANMLKLYNATRGVVDTLVKQGVGVGYSDYGYRNDRYIPQHNPPNDRYIGAEPHRPCIAYYDDRDDRYRDDRYRDDDRFRHRYTPPSQSHYNASRCYNGYSNCIADPYEYPQPREAPDVVTDCAAYDTAPVRSPNYTPAEVHGITDNATRGDSAAGPSKSQQAGSSTERPAQYSDERRNVTEKAQSPALRRGGWGKKLFEAAKKDLALQSAYGEPVTFRPATPFLKAVSKKDVLNKQSDQTTANGTNDRPTSSAVLPNADYTKIGCGNVSWDVAGRGVGKRGRQYLGDQPRDEVVSKTARVVTSDTGLDAEERRQSDEQDPVLRQLYSRNLPSTTRNIAATIREKTAISDK